MILPDHEIERLALAGMITPFNPDQLNPASYNVRASNDIMLEDGGIMIMSNITGRSCIRLEPGEFILASTIEKFSLPLDVCAQFALRSTWARKGLEHAMAGFCDPGWHNSVLTMELKNNLQYEPIVISVGECIGQMVFFRMESAPRKGYSGRYNNDSTVQGAKE